MKKLLPLAVLLVGCAPSTMYMPDGKPANVADCSGALSNWSYCLKKASDTCGDRGYTVLDRDGETVPVSVVTAQDRQVIGTGGGINRHLYFRCKT